MLSENKAISNQLVISWISIWYNGDRYEMLIRTLNSFLITSINILDNC